MKRISGLSARAALSRRAALLSLFSLGLLSAAATTAQTLQQRLDAAHAPLVQLQTFVSKLSPTEKAKLSASAQHALYTALNWDQMSGQFTPAQLSAPVAGHAFVPRPSLSGGQVSDSGTDLAQSRMAGFTKSETSTAWCGSHVVVAFNDSGSLLETLFIPNLGLSFNGYSLSTDGGSTFTDEGYLNPGPNIFNFLEGDPVVVCTSPRTFFYSSLFETAGATGVSVSKSNDGGRTFGNPVAAVLKDSTFHFIDKPWMAADPSNPNRLYVTYTDFDITGFFFPATAPCPNNQRVGIELVSSVDGGMSWSNPEIIDNGCFPNEDQGSNPAVDNHGNVYVAWEGFPALLPTNELDIVKSTNGGTTFGPKVTITIVTVVGSPFGLLQGGFRNNEFPNLAIDRSHGSRDGTLYIFWNDGRNGATADYYGFYNFGDAFVTSSTNGGATWSAPIKINNDASGTADHFLPAGAVDGCNLGACFYDRRYTAYNFLIDRVCARSHDGGLTWTNNRVTPNSFPISIEGDLFINPVYMGDYDSDTADWTGRHEGLQGAYTNNGRGKGYPNVYSESASD